MKILLVFAMEEESKKTVQHFGFTQHNEFNSRLTSQVFKKNIYGHEVLLANLGIDERFKVNSVGTIPAALTTFELLSKFDVDLVINPGTAGGFSSRGGDIGDIYLPTEILFHHREIPMGLYENYGLGRFKAFDMAPLEKTLEFKKGVFSTSDSLTCRSHELEFFDSHKVVVKEMEAGAIAYVCERFKKPYLGVKSITDIVDGPRVTSEEFLENLDRASRSLQGFLESLLRHFLNNKS
jgi:5'-methylthioadenosine nucleosidase